MMRGHEITAPPPVRMRMRETVHCVHVDLRTGWRCRNRVRARGLCCWQHRDERRREAM